MTFVCFVASTGETETRDAAQLVNKTASQILQALSHPHDCLFVSTPEFCRCLKPNEIPLIEYPALTVHYQPRRYERPDYFLSVLPEGCEDCLCASLTISSSNSADFPPFRVWFSCPAFSAVSFKVLRRHILSGLGLEVSSAKFVTQDGQEVTDLEYAKDVMEQIAAGTVTMAVEMTRESIVRMAERGELISRFIADEEEFLSKLAPLVEQWIPEIERFKFVSSVDFSVVFRRMLNLYHDRRELLDKLKAAGTVYSSRVAEIVVCYAEHIRQCAAFFEAYPSAVEVFTLMNMNDDTRWKLRDMESEFHTPSLEDLYNLPFERLREYGDLAEALKPLTPISHPDHQIGNIGATIMRESLDVVEKAIGVCRRQADLMRLQLSILNDVTFLENGRTLLETFDVSITGKNRSKGTLFLFNDLVLIVRNLKAIIKSDVAQFSYNYQWLNEHTIAVANEKRLYAVEFLDASAKLQFYDLLKGAQNTLIDKSFATLNIVWDNVEMLKPLPVLAKHTCIAYEGSIFVITPENGVYNLNIDGKLFEKYNDINGQYACRIGDGIYIISSDSIYRFSPQVNHVNKLDVYVEPKVGRTLATCGDRLFLFGGKSTADKLGNDLFSFKPDDRRLEKIRQNGTVPSPRFDHSASVYAESMFVFGGKTDAGISNELYRLDLHDYTWEKIIIDGLLPRAGHSSAVVNSLLVLIGGAQPTQIIDLETMSLVSMAEFGNVPKSIQYFGIEINSNEPSEIFLIGGMEDRIKTNNFWSVKLDADSVSTPVRKRRAKGIPIATTEEVAVPSPRSPTVPCEGFLEEIRLEDERRIKSQTRAAVFAVQRREEQEQVAREHMRLEEARRMEAERIEIEARQLEVLKKASAKRRLQSSARSQLMDLLEKELEEDSPNEENVVDSVVAQLEETPLEEIFAPAPTAADSQAQQSNFLTGNAMDDDVFHYTFPGESEPQTNTDWIDNLVPLTSPKAATITAALTAVFSYFQRWRKGS